MRAEEEARCAEEREKVEEMMKTRMEAIAEWKRDQLQKKQV